AAESVFIGSETGSGFSGTVPNGSYDKVYGGKIESGSATASENVLNLGSGQKLNVSAEVYGGYASGTNATASSNSVQISDATLSSAVSPTSMYGYVFAGGYAIIDGDGTATASQNSLLLKNVEFSEKSADAQYVTGYAMRGGYAEVANGTATASGNSLYLENVIFNGSDTMASGGRRYIRAAEAKVGGYVNGFYTGEGDATASGNTLTLVNVESAHSMYAGYARVGTGTATTENNTINIYGGSFTGRIYAAESNVGDEGTAVSKNNTVALYTYEGASPVFSETNTTIYGGRARVNGVDAQSSGNTLEFHGVQGMTAGNIKNFNSLVFELPTMNADAVVMTLTGNDGQGTSDETTDLSAATVDVQKIAGLKGADGGEFKVGDKVYLLKNSNGIETSAKTVLKTVNYKVGGLLEYAMNIETDGSDTEDATSVYLVRTGETKVRQEAKALAEGSLAGLALASEAANASIAFTKSFTPEAGVVAPFVHVQGSSVTHETGSSIHLNSISLLAGIGTGIDTGAGKLSAGAFFEYGKGSYTTDNSFDNAADVNGDGNSWYMGGGILAKMEFIPTGPGHFYVEGSAHMGTLHNEYDSSDLSDGYGRAAGFDMDSPYYSLHGGLGYLWNMAEGHDLDIYGRYIWTRVQGTDDTLTTGDKYKYDDLDSSRVQFGVRYTYTGSERFQPYVGVAYEHEFAGSCDAKTLGHKLASPSFEGDTGIGELGITMTPSETLPLSFNLGVQGYTGQKRGVSGNCMVRYEF
ncbi:MAG: autotransporter outer membrane beta-barrel domain-containing protein, partial [Desulfovibrionaceae bacterium]|nr:autotransporter outer membrane beta-barrel domain-containing protein [Desulfovibrionaceae bacterium]